MQGSVPDDPDGGALSHLAHGGEERVEGGPVAEDDGADGGLPGNGGPDVSELAPAINRRTALNDLFHLSHLFSRNALSCRQS